MLATTSAGKSISLLSGFSDVFGGAKQVAWTRGVRAEFVAEGLLTIGNSREMSMPGSAIAAIAAGLTLIPCSCRGSSG